MTCAGREKICVVIYSCQSACIHEIFPGTMFLIFLENESFLHHLLVCEDDWIIFVLFFRNQ